MDDQLTINDLPVECIDEILSWITDREHRIYARFVCKLWCALIDQDCSTEKYLIDGKEIKCNPLYQLDGGSSIDVSKIYSIFFNSQRKKTSFHFVRFNFRGSEQFWSRKGAGIISLYFGKNCSNIPLSEIIEHCSTLKSITFEFSCFPRIEEMLEKCVSDGKSNYSVRFLYFNRQELGYINDIANVTRLVGQVFLGVRKLILHESECLFYADDINFNQPSNVDLLSTTFENLKFEITMINQYGSFIFDPAGNVPVRMITLKNYIRKLYIDEVPTHLSRYSCDRNHLNGLNFRLENQDKLDNVQELISQWPSLKEIFVTVGTRIITHPLTNPLDSNKNNIDYLNLLNPNYPSKLNFWSIDDTFLQFFQNLRTFVCDHTLDFSDFVKLLRELPHLEDLNVPCGFVDVDPVQTISNEKLLKLKMPCMFLHRTITKYNFGNLKDLSVMYDTMMIGELNPNDVDKYLNRMNCPKLEILELEFSIRKCWRNQDELTQWMLNILALFPRLIKFLIGWHDILISSCKGKDNCMKEADEIIKTILKNHRRLREIGYRTRSHRLKILSPSYIKHYNYFWYDCRVSVLHVP